jgi:membrane-bound lytic murein transglycosylase D
MRYPHLLPVVLALTSAALLTGCSTLSLVQSAPSPEPQPVSSARDSYALSPPPELILPRDESLEGAWSEMETVPTQTEDSQKTSGDLWARLRAGFSLSRERLEVRDSARQLATGRNHLNNTLRRGEPYLWHMVQEVEARGMPIEIALLPAVESAYDPNAYSPSHAVGLWQFMPGTGTRFGLRRNWWYDGRRDVTESTRAALDYLSYLHDMFKDWPLALAAYNSGEGRVQQALQANRSRGLPEDFWSLSLPAETRNYVPRLLGLAELLSNPEQYGYALAPLSDEPRFEIVELPGQVELELAAGLIDLDPKILQQLNPGFSRWATDPEGPHRLLVPHGQGERLRQAIAVLPTDTLVRWHQYVAEDGDNLSVIANRYGVQPALLQEVNNMSGTAVMAGTELRIPRAFAREVPLTDAPATVSHRTSKTYTIRSGDSLWSIAQLHGVRVSDLLRWNNLTRSTTLQPGRKLVIRNGSKTTDT